MTVDSALNMFKVSKTDTRTTLRRHPGALFINFKHKAHVDIVFLLILVF